MNMVKLGDQAIFNCEVTGQTLYSIHWLHNGSPIPNQTGKFLKMSNVQPPDQGMYQCIVKDAFKSVQACSELKLTGRLQTVL